MIRLRRGKWRACGSVPSGISATITPCSRERVVEPAVLLGIDDVDAAGDDRDGAGVERALMRRGVDAAGQTRDDDEPGRAEPAASSRAKRRPLAEALRAPTTATSARASNSASPSTVRTGGASSIAASSAG